MNAPSIAERLTKYAAEGREKAIRKAADDYTFRLGDGLYTFADRADAEADRRDRKARAHVLMKIRRYAENRLPEKRKRKELANNFEIVTVEKFITALDADIADLRDRPGPMKQTWITAYADWAVKHWEALTGKKPTRSESLKKLFRECCPIHVSKLKTDYEIRNALTRAKLG